MRASSALAVPTMAEAMSPGVIEPSAEVRSMVGRSSVPVSVIVTSELLITRFGGDVELGMDVPPIGE